MATKVVHLQVRGGIQRDGTSFRSPYYTEGEWCRFQTGRPRKIGGYRAIFLNAAGISRGMLMTTTGGLNYIISGYDAGLQQWRTNADAGVGTGPFTVNFIGPIAQTTITDAGTSYTAGTYTSVPVTGGSGTGAQATVSVDSSGNVTGFVVTKPGVGYATGDVLSVTNVSIGGTGSGLVVTVTQTAYFTPDANTLWQMDTAYDPYGSGNYQIIAHPGQNLADISSLVNTRPLVGTFTGTDATAVGVFTETATLTSGTNKITFATTVAAVGAGVAVSGTGIPAGTTVLSVANVSGVYTATLSANTTASGAQSLTFDANISVSGGAVMLYPYLFVYGNYGLIQNSSAGNFNDWVSSDSNANNVASTKIVKGIPLRGGSSSPAGLFFSLDSVIRVTYTPTTVGGLTYYWTYDIIASQSSILSSSCVIEYDGIIYWCGVDRFLMYNGVVQEVPNSMNLNWFFDNLNYEQRQKVWASKVPRWGEIWFFYPRGNATECTDAIIYNVREQIWYDAGSAPGAARSAGTFSEVFRFPVWGGTEVNTDGKYSLWQHEIGKDMIYGPTVNAIQSYFETPGIGNLMGLIGSTQQLQEPWMQIMPPDSNNWTTIDQMEPDFQQVGDMTVQVRGRGYANDVSVDSPLYSFGPTTLKVNMREQRRELRLRFDSNTQGGDYYMGRILLTLNVGDVRSTGNP
ncbi:MAG: hypothetical protein WC829_01430 [Hyphomicrobium sp.]